MKKRIEVGLLSSVLAFASGCDALCEVFALPAGCFRSTVDACTIIDGVSFDSIELLPGGQDVDGNVVLIRWRLTFENGEYDWTTFDMVASGAYQCEGLEIHAEEGGREIMAEFNPLTGVLTWDGQEYERIDP